MIVRTPPTKRPRPEAKSDGSPRVGSERGLIIFEDLQPPAPPPLPESSSSHPLLCTYQCRQMVKADFFDALSNAEKQVVEYQSKLEELNGNLSKAEAEGKRFRDQLLYAEQELAAVKGREQALQDQLLKEINDSRERLKKQLESCSNLEIKLENERKLREKAETSAASAEEKATVLEEKLGSLSDTIEREKKHLNMELLHVQQESKFSISKTRGDLERMECRANNAEKESKLLNGQLENLKTQLKKCLNEKSELEQKLSSFMCHDGSSTEDNILIKHLQDELRKCESEVREARKLKSSHENVALIKEKLLEEKSRRERVESELSQLREIELKMKKLEDELSSWKLIMNDIPGVSCPDDVSIKFAALQKELINNMMKMGEANARVKELQVALDDAQLCKQNAESESALVKEKAEGLKLEVNKLEHTISRITEERDRLRKVVEDFKRSNNDQPRAVIADEGHLQELESSLANKEGCIKQLESDIHEAKEVNNRQLLEIEVLNGRLNNEVRRLKSLERENDRLRSEISLLESKLGHGDFSAANTKVLRMVNTLALESEAKQTIEALQTELQKTKEKLQAVEELKSQSGDAGQLVDSNISAKIMQLKEQIATLEKREERYKTVFADRISVFRRACCELFGYKIVMDEHQRSNGIPVTHFTLQSIYAQSDNEKLEFEYESGTTNILANEYTSQPEISHQVDIFVRKMNSIPAFTANLTVESFNKRTLS